VKVQQVQKEQEIKVQEAEIQRHENELIASVLKGAEIERRRIEMMALAEKQRRTAEAEGMAAAVRAQGEAESDIIVRRGTAEADIILKKGEAEAKAMNVKAAAYQEWNQAAVVDKLITNMPEVVRALASPLANVDKITIVSTGNGDSAGMHKITGDMAAMAAQIPALFETLSGMKMSELLGKVKTIGDKAPKEKGTEGGS
jgi:flotillin